MLPAPWGQEGEAPWGCAEGAAGIQTVGVLCTLGNTGLREAAQALAHLAQEVTETSALDMRRAGFRSLWQLLSKVPWGKYFEGAGVHQHWLLFNDHLLKAQEQAIPKCMESSRQGRRLLG